MAISREDGINKVLEGIGRGPKEGANAIRQIGNSVTGQRNQAVNIVNGFIQQHHLEPTPQNYALMNTASAHLASINGNRNDIKGIYQQVTSGQLNAGNFGGAASTIEKATAEIAKSIGSLTAMFETSSKRIEAVGKGLPPPGSPGGPTAGGGGVNGGSGGGNGPVNGAGPYNSPPPPSGWSQAWSSGRGIVGGLMEAEQTVKALTVSYPIEKKRIAAELASRQNEQYQLAIGAASGNASDLLLKRGMAFENSTDFAHGIGNNAVRSKVVGGVFEAAGGAMNAVTSFASGDVSGGISSAAGAIGGAIRNGAQLNMGMTRGSSEVMAYTAKMAQLRAENEVPAALLQTSIDYQKTLAESTYSMGGGRSDFIDASNREEILKKMKGRYGNANEQAAVAGAINSATGMSGPRFNSSTGFWGDGNNSISAAGSLKDLERSGYGGVGENVSRMGAMAGAGANNSLSALANAVGQAVASGFDNSKAVGMMVESTAAIASQSGMSASGVDGTGGITALLGSLVRSQGGENQFQAMAMANKTVATSSQIAQDTSTNLPNMLRYAKLKTLFGTGAEANAAMKITPEQLEVMRQGGKNGQNMADSLGLGDSLYADGTPNASMLNQVGDIQHTNQLGSMAGRLTSAELGSTIDAEKEVEALARKQGVKISELRGLPPKLRRAQKALTMKTENRGTSWTNGTAPTYSNRGTDPGKGGSDADTPQAAAGAVKTAQIIAGNRIKTPGQVAGEIKEEITNLTPELLGKMAVASKEVATNMGFNTVQLKTLNTRLQELNTTINKVGLRVK